MTAAQSAAQSGVHSVVDSVTERLSELSALPVAEHVAVFDQVHRLLQDALATVDQA